jgi:hypothetical protein
VLDGLLNQLGEFARAAVALPSQASRLLAQAETGGFLVRSPQVTRDLERLGRSIDHLTGGVIFAALLFSGAQLYNAGNEALGTVLLTGAAITLLWVLFGPRRS